MDELTRTTWRTQKKRANGTKKCRYVPRAIQSLIASISQASDGTRGGWEKGNLDKIEAHGRHSAASMVMLSPINREGAKLRTSDRYREAVISHVTVPPEKRRQQNLSTESMQPKSWEEALFERCPWQQPSPSHEDENDIRSSEGKR